MADTVKIGLDLIVDGFNVALKSATSQSEVFQKKAVSNFQAVQTSFAVMAGSLAASAFEKIASSVNDTFRNVINEAAASEDAINKLNIALRASGLYSEKSSKSLQEYAADLQKITIYSDEQIMATESLLLSLTTLDEKGIKEATKAAVNLAATLGVDLPEATDMVTKAINGNVIAFKKKGITIQSADTDAQRLTNTLKALSSQEGAAEAATNTYAGAIAKQKNQHSELSESLGKLITQNATIKSAIDASSESYAKAADFITNNKKLIDDLITTFTILVGGAATVALGFYAVSTALTAMGVAAALGVTAFQAIGIAAGIAWSAITAPITLVVAGVAAVSFAVYELVKHWDDIKIATYNAMAATLEFAAKGAEVFSSKKAESLREQAQAWRDKAVTIRESSIVLAENDKVDEATSIKRRARLSEELADIARINNNKLESTRLNAAAINQVQTEFDIASREAKVAHEQALADTTSQFDASKLESTLATQQQLLAARNKYESDLLEIHIQGEINKANLEKDVKKRNDDLKLVNEKANLDRAKLNSKNELEITKARFKDEELLNKQRESNQKDTFATLATLSTSSNQTLASIGKAAGITQIAIDTPVAISKALAAFPPPFNFAAAALVGTAMAAQAANIAGVKFADGGVVPGSENSGDRIRASLNSGEMVLNKQQQSKLFAIANGRGPQQAPQDNGRVEQLISMVSDVLNQPIAIKIDGREIINVTRSQLAKGRSFV